MIAQATCNSCGAKMPAREVFSLEEFKMLGDDPFDKILTAKGRCECGGDLEMRTSAKDVFTMPLED